MPPANSAHGAEAVRDRARRGWPREMFLIASAATCDPSWLATSA
jgi:hypothetical protein